MEGKAEARARVRAEGRRRAKVLKAKAGAKERQAGACSRVPEELWDTMTPAEAGIAVKNALPGETIRQYKDRMGERIKKGSDKYAEMRLTKKQIKAKIAAARKKVRVRSLSEVDLAGDILWVYENMGDVEVDFDDAPGVGALNLLDWAKKDEQTGKAFFNTTLPKALSIQEGRERAVRDHEQRLAPTREGKVADLSLGEVERLLKEFAGEEA